MGIFKPIKKDLFQTSARLLIRYAEEKYYKKEENQNVEKYVIIYDIFIKTRSYYITNKIFFVLSLVSGVLVLLWPSIGHFGWHTEFFKLAIVQTTVTGLAALSFAFYSHYKKRQMYAENLMRFVIFSEEPLANIKDYVMREMERIDCGFSFGKSVIKEEELEKSGTIKSSETNQPQPPKKN